MRNLSNLIRAFLFVLAATTLTVMASPLPLSSQAGHINYETIATSPTVTYNADDSQAQLSTGNQGQSPTVTYSADDSQAQHSAGNQEKIASTVDGLANGA